MCFVWRGWHGFQAVSGSVVVDVFPCDELNIKLHLTSMLCQPILTSGLRILYWHSAGLLSEFSCPEYQGAWLCTDSKAVLLHSVS